MQIVVETYNMVTDELEAEREVAHETSKVWLVKHIDWCVNNGRGVQIYAAKDNTSEDKL